MTLLNSTKEECRCSQIHLDASPVKLQRSCLQHVFEFMTPSTDIPVDHQYVCLLQIILQNCRFILGIYHPEMVKNNIALVCVHLANNCRLNNQIFFLNSNFDELNSNNKNTPTNFFTFCFFFFFVVYKAMTIIGFFQSKKKINKKKVR